LQDVVRQLQLEVLFAEPLQLLALLGGETGPRTRVDLGTLHPDAQRLFTNPELSRYPRDDTFVARI
jgi:hypothetical protein